MRELIFKGIKVEEIDLTNKLEGFGSPGFA